MFRAAYSVPFSSAEVNTVTKTTSPQNWIQTDRETKTEKEKGEDGKASGSGSLRGNGWRKIKDFSPRSGAGKAGLKGRLPCDTELSAPGCQRRHGSHSAHQGPLIDTLSPCPRSSSPVFIVCR
ncbi:hypothetical protein ACOMHN_011858 [Nucella lapillus]